MLINSRSNKYKRIKQKKKMVFKLSFIILFMAELLLLTSIVPPASALEDPSEKIVDVKNVAPVANFTMKEVPKVDLLFNVDYTKYTTGDMQSKISSLMQPSMQVNGIDFQYHVTASGAGGADAIQPIAQNGQGVYLKTDGTAWTTGGRLIASDVIDVKAFSYYGNSSYKSMSPSYNYQQYIYLLKSDQTLVQEVPYGVYDSNCDCDITNYKLVTIATNVVKMKPVMNQIYYIKADGTAYRGPNLISRDVIDISAFMHQRQDYYDSYAQIINLTILKMDGTLQRAAENVTYDDDCECNIPNGTFTLTTIATNVAKMQVGDDGAYFIKRDGTYSDGKQTLNNIADINVYSGPGAGGGEVTTLLLLTADNTLLVRSPVSVYDYDCECYVLDHYNYPVVSTHVVKMQAGTTFYMYIKDDGTLWKSGSQLLSGVADVKFVDERRLYETYTNSGGGHRDTGSEYYSDIVILKSDGTVTTPVQQGYEDSDGNFVFTGYGFPNLGSNGNTSVAGYGKSTLLQNLQSNSWRGNSFRYVIDLADWPDMELNSSPNHTQILYSLLSNGVSFIGFGNAVSQGQLQKFVTLVGNYSAYYDDANIDYQMSLITNVIITNVLANTTLTNSVVLHKDPSTGQYSSNQISYQTTYTDRENDLMNGEKWLYNHNPNQYENPMGVASFSGQSLPSPITQFYLPGLYATTLQKQDNPKNDPRFANYWLWSSPSATLDLFVNREPEAQFIPSVYTSNGNYYVSIADRSYDLDHYTQPNNGIVNWVWKWKTDTDTSWTNGTPFALSPNTNYFISEKVQDMDGAWSKETVRLVTTGNINLPPVALFTVTPPSVSLSGNYTINDLSYDPDNNPIVTRVWIASKNGVTVFSGNAAPTAADLKSGASSQGISQSGTYMITLKVEDYNAALNSSLWSDPYSQNVDISNHPPVPSFTGPSSTYRDTVNNFVNTTPTTDQDGDAVNVHWYAVKGTSTYDWGTSWNISPKIESLGLGKNAVGNDWMIKLVACDPYGACATYALPLVVANQSPVAAASGPSTSNLNSSATFINTDYDPDSDDTNNLTYNWDVIAPSGNSTHYTTSSITPTFTEQGQYHINHWAVDQLGASSNVFTLTVTINGLAPVPGFTVTPNPAYRTDTVQIQSTAYDPDPNNYISQYQYYATPPGGTEAALSSTKDWTNTFGTLGTWSIRQVVTNNIGQTAQISHQLTILNQAPTVTLTNPSSTDINNPSGGTPPFTATWSYLDPENDAQSKYQVKIYQASNNALVSDSGVISGTATSYSVPLGLLTMGQTYYMTVQAWDYYGAASNIDKKYFVTDRPPTGTLSIDPSVVYQNDNVYVTIDQSDPDGDPVNIQLESSFNGGTYSTIYLAAAVPSGTQKIIEMQNVPLGSYTLRLTLTDPFGLSYTTTLSFIAHQLQTIGSVNHTTQWENNRQSYNAANPSTPRSPDTFWAGERFMVSADVTNTGTATIPTSVTATLLSVGSSTTLSSTNNVNWSGELWNSSFVHLADGPYTVRFTTVWSNGYVQTYDVPITIKDSIYSFLVTQLRD